MDHSVFGTWHGGVNYAQGTRDEDLEVFESIRAAKEALLSRAQSGHWRSQTFVFARPDGEHVVENALTPNADEGASITLYGTFTSEEPFRLLEIGPRGGVKETAL